MEKNETAETIVVLKGLQPVRRRPGMYVGDTDDGTGLHNMLLNVIENSVDEHVAGNASCLRVSFQRDGAVSVEDDGRGASLTPLRLEPDITALESVMTQLYAGVRWASVRELAENHPWGVGLAVVNALSSRLEVETSFDGRRYLQEFAEGEIRTSVRDLGPTDRRGARVTFTPDYSIFRRHPWNLGLVARCLRERAALYPSLTTILDDRAFRCPDGLVDLVRFLGRRHRWLHREPIHISGEHSGVHVDAALLWTDASRTRVRGFVGRERIPSGTHLRGMSRGLFHAFAEVDGARFASVNRRAFREVVRPGLVALVRVRLAEPRLIRPMRNELQNPEVLTAVDELVRAQLAGRLREDRELHETLLARMPG